MPFPDPVKDQAFLRSRGRCECARIGHIHPAHPIPSLGLARLPGGRCRRLVTRQTAEFHHIIAANAGGPDTLANCEVLCHDCHVGTASYGRS